MNKVLKYQLIVLFFGVLLLPFLNDGLNFVEYERKDENRTFKDSLSLDFARLDNFPKDAEAYINDNFSFRVPLLNAYSTIKYLVFQNSPKPEKTIIGMDGWMFMASDEVDCYSGFKNFSERQLDTLKDVWTNRTSYFKSKNISSYWVIAPTKHAVYSSKLPFSIVKSKKPSRVEQIKKALNNNATGFIIDPSSQLKNQSKKEKVFYKMDNHWNFRAGKIAATQLLERINVDFPNVNKDFQVEWKDTVLKKGIHYNVVGLDFLFERDYVPILKASCAVEVEKFHFEWPENFTYYWEFERRFKNPSAKNDLKILVIRDSFGEHVMPFIAEKFSESLFIFDAWQYGLNKNIIEAYKPDIVVYLTVDNLLESLLKTD